MRLAYYSVKDGTFHEKYYRYEEREVCKKDYNTLKRMRVLFCYTDGGMGFYGVDSHGLGHGKFTTIEELPASIADKFIQHIQEDDSREYGGKRELGWDVYENKYWYSLRISLGEDDFENEVIHEYFITKDGKSEYNR